MVLSLILELFEYIISNIHVLVLASPLVIQFLEQLVNVAKNGMTGISINSPEHHLPVTTNAMSYTAN